MSDANEQTAKGPSAPKADRMAKARAAKTAKDNRIAELEAQIAALQEHKSQIGEAPIKALRKRLRARMAEAGKGPGYKLAESFRRLSWG